MRGRFSHLVQVFLSVVVGWRIGISKVCLKAGATQPENHHIPAQNEPGEIITRHSRRSRKSSCSPFEFGIVNVRGTSVCKIGVTASERRPPAPHLMIKCSQNAVTVVLRLRQFVCYLNKTRAVISNSSPFLKLGTHML